MLTLIKNNDVVVRLNMFIFSMINYAKNNTVKITAF